MMTNFTLKWCVKWDHRHLSKHINFHFKPCKCDVCWIFFFLSVSIWDSHKVSSLRVIRLVIVLENLHQGSKSKSWKKNWQMWNFTSCHINLPLSISTSMLFSLKKENKIWKGEFDEVCLKTIIWKSENKMTMKSSYTGKNTFLKIN